MATTGGPVETVQEATQAIAGIDRAGWLEKGRDRMIQFGFRLIAALLVVWIGMKIIKRISKLIDKGLTKGRVDTTLRHFLSSFASIILKVVLFGAALTILGVKTASFIALLGAAGLAIGLSLQGSLAHFASGVLILLFRPYKYDDVVKVGGVTGVVQSIGLLFTTILTFDKRTAMVPNGEIMGNTIINYSLQGVRRFDVPVGIGYGENINETKKILLDMMASHELVLNDPEPEILVSSLGASSIDLTVRGHCRAHDYLTVMSDITQQTKERLDDAQIEIPYPHTVIYSMSGASESGE